MPDINALLPSIASTLGMSPTTLLMVIGLVYLVCLSTSRLIPDTATGWKGTVRDVAGAISFDISSRIAPGITIAAAVKAAAQTPPVQQAVEAQTGAEVPAIPTVKV